MSIAAAVDIGGSSTKMGIVADDGAILRRTRVPTPPGGNPLPLVDAVVSALRLMLDEMHAGGQQPLGVGVSVAGFLDRERAIMVENPNLASLCGFPLRRTLEERLGLPCRLEVDSNAAAIAEYRHGAGRGARRMLGITVGTGLGGGVIIDEAVVRHTGECAGDVGHIILDPKGPRCPCGAHGCLEALVSSSALSRRAGGRSVRQVVASAQEGTVEAVAALAETGWWLGLGLASLVPLFAPEIIVIGGGVATAGELLLEPTRASFLTHAAPELARKARIVGASFDGWEGTVGAGSIFLHPLP